MILMQKMRIVITDVYDLKYNYGVQRLVLTLIDKIKEKIPCAEFIMPVQSAYCNRANIEFAGKRGIRLVKYWKYSFVFELIHPLLKLAGLLRNDPDDACGPNNHDNGRKCTALAGYRALIASVSEAGMVIDAAGIEFIGNSGLKNKWGELLFCRMFQRLAKRYKKPYFKYTKSYGPFEGLLFRSVVKKLLEKLPFILVRGRNNLESMHRLGLKTQLYLFPDISLVLKPAPAEWAERYLGSLGIDISKPLTGISPSRVLSRIDSGGSDNITGMNHRELCIRLINEYSDNGSQVLVIPHAIDRIDKNKCDRQLAAELLEEAGHPEGVFLAGEGLSYSEVRALIGKLSYYITGRYHSVASALYMGTPVVSLAWHVKYTDIMGEFLDDPPVIDSRNTSIDEACSLIRKFRDDLSWFDREKVRENRERIGREVERSIQMILESTL